MLLQTLLFAAVVFVNGLLIWGSAKAVGSDRAWLRRVGHVLVWVFFAACLYGLTSNGMNIFREGWNWFQCGLAIQNALFAFLLAPIVLMDLRVPFKLRLNGTDH